MTRKSTELLSWADGRTMRKEEEDNAETQSTQSGAEKRDREGREDQRREDKNRQESREERAIFSPN
jgi:hypothetical protein